MEILFTFDLHKFGNLDVNREICKHCTLEMDLKIVCYFGHIVFKTEFIYIIFLKTTKFGYFWKALDQCPRLVELNSYYFERI